ncbi:hypothetical protein ABZ719_07495 [Streptomyces sp. NPDC006743]|uniref:hypothetical protein n=1 Tax=Streptomyces sp. NPDC006743 TaxID=3154480 RepID=UPI0034569BFB
MGADPFEDMSHEEMLAWLDEANANDLQAGADKFLAAAKEIEKIAGELKTRPQYVEWKGQGADSFRTWSGDFANATLRVADYANDSGMYLSHAADAIARAKASVPRDDGGAQANIDAAKAAPHDPDSAGILAMATAQKEQVRQQTADEMTKLGQAYQQSAEQIAALGEPAIPPPPAAIVPKGSKSIGSGKDTAFPGTATGSAPSDAVSSAGVTGDAGIASEGTPDHAPQGTVTGHAGGVSAGGTLHADPASVPHTGIDSTAILPTTHTPTATSVAPLPTHSPATSGPSTPSVPVPPMTGPATGRTGTLSGAKLPSRPSQPPGQGRTIGTTRPPTPGQGTARPRTGMPGFEDGRTAPGAGHATASAQYGRTPGARGIVGGRPSQPPTGRAMPYRGIVVGGEPEGQATMGRSMSGGRAEGRSMTGSTPGGCPGSVPRPGTGRGVVGNEGFAGAATPRGQTPAGSTAAPGRGVMGAPPAQRTARTASGERAVPGTAASRDGIAGGLRTPQRDGKKRRNKERRDQRPGFVAEDEETWLPDRRRIVPPTVD